MANTQTRRRRKLGGYLQELRKRAEWTPEAVAEALGISRPTVNRMESGHTRCRRAELQAMLGFYRATERQRAKAVQLWEDAKDDAVRIRFPARSSSAFRNFLQAESEANSLDVLDSYAVSGLLQTPDYARAVQNPAASPFEEEAAEVERYVTSRLERQRRLTGTDPLRLRAFLDESVITREIGGVDVLIGQLGHLLEMGDRENVTVRILPFGLGAYGTMCGGVTVVDFGDSEDPPVVYLEHAGGGAWVEDGEAIQRYVHMMRGLDAVALSESASAELIRHRMKALEGDDRLLA
ncbi:transcriptional regulator with XRE-family HTH domain [Saccharothrix coeruleofusca]|uniref:helix-turn-helix domain-containing protein n=1 Tax=Saccharothrix coeruleofusca TaxID=33919 RepID=UPI001AE76FD9|nr:helix-turn-helix transcriptional regulator [Saccharothrix coeruleofusca]MBP2339819.1 transcriptional regulator with XRE-family HTH domain [Saccharothrix coeruleofusca]